MILTKTDSPKAPAPHLTDGYHKARRSLALTSGVFIVWEILGIEIGGQAKIPGADIPVILKNPRIVPTLIFVLVLYFAARTMIEWYQCDPNRRRHPASRIYARR